MKNKAVVDRVDVAVTLHLKAGRVEVPQTSIVRDAADDWRLVPAKHVQDLNAAVQLRGAACVRVLEEIQQFKAGIHAAQWESHRLGMLAEDRFAHIRDLQMLRATAEVNQVGALCVAMGYRVHVHCEGDRTGGTHENNVFAMVMDLRCLWA
jgi:hypothetical protein